MATTLTDANVDGLPLAKPGRRYEVMDAKVAGLVVRVSATNKSYMLYAKLPGGRNHVRRAIGPTNKLSVKRAREIARDWHALIADGADPRDDQRRRAEEEDERRREEARRRRDTFASVAETFIELHLAGKRHAAKDEALIRRWLVPEWGARPIADIRRRDVVALIERIAATGKRRTAHLAFGHARSLFGWAVRRDAYGLENSPCFGVRSEDHAGKKRKRTHHLNDAELVALWRACEQIEAEGNPHGAVVRLLMLTGTRRNEAGAAAWGEFDLDKAEWVVPASRFKSEAEHRVPLSPAAVALLRSVPRPEKKDRRGDFVFTTTRGERPVGDYSGAKKLLDARMAAVLDAAPRAWVLHDLRHTFRTKLAQLGVRREVAERAIGHAQRDPLERTYDHFDYARDIRAAMELWAEHLAKLLRPKPRGDGKVPVLAEERAKRRRRA